MKRDKIIVIVLGTVLAVYFGFKLLSTLSKANQVIDKTGVVLDKVSDVEVLVDTAARKLNDVDTEGMSDRVKEKIRELDVRGFYPREASETAN